MISKEKQHFALQIGVGSNRKKVFVMQIAVFK